MLVLGHSKGVWIRTGCLTKEIPGISWIFCLMGHKNKHPSNPACTCCSLLVKLHWGSANPPFWNVGGTWTDLNYFIFITVPWFPSFLGTRDNKGFDSIGIVTILSQFLKFLDPLLILLTLLQNVLNALPVELLVCFITDFSQMNELFVTSSWISSS